MNLREYLAQNTFVKALVKGPPGEGKTVLAAMATQIWRTLYIDVDGGLISALPVVKEDNLTIRLIREPKHEDFFDRLADAVAEAETGQYECVVVDHLSEICGRMEDDYAQQSKSGKMEFGAWSEFLARITRFVRRLRDLQAHVIGVCHTKSTGKEDSTAIFELAISGQAAVRVPGMFDVIGLVRKKMVKGQPGYFCAFDGPGIYQVRDRFRILAAEEEVSEKEPGRIWRKLQEGIVGKVPAQTLSDAQ